VEKTEAETAVVEGGAEERVCKVLGATVQDVGVGVTEAVGENNVEVEKVLRAVVEGAEAVDFVEISEHSEGTRASSHKN
jgi:hypothetical protein